MGRALRTLHGLKTRQPLRALHLVTRDRREQGILIEMEDIIREELNVKEVILRENEEDLVEYTAKANFRKLGSVLGKSMPKAAARIAELSAREIQVLLEGAVLHIDVDDRTLEITRDDLIIQRNERDNLKALNEGSLTVALDPEITDDLRQEGLVRDLIRQIQNLRKESGLEVSDRIRLYLDGPSELRDAVESNDDYLLGEVLAISLEWGTRADASPLTLGDVACRVALEKAG